MVIPKEFIGGTSSIYDIFMQISADIGDSKEYATELVKLLPGPIKQSDVWYCRLTKKWRYNYGNPFNGLPGNSIISGTNDNFPVLHLYQSVKIADNKLTRVQLLKYLRRIEDIEKHNDVLFEMRPIINLNSFFQPEYEKCGLGEGNRNVDWYIHKFGINIVFDVKNRVKSLINHIKEIKTGITEGEKNINPNLFKSPEPIDLFKSVECKLKEKCFLSQIQGVWIKTGIKEDKQKLNSFFENDINKKKIHFAIISDWRDDAYILVRNRLIKMIIKKVFNIYESDRFISNEYHQ